MSNVFSGLFGGDSRISGRTLLRTLGVGAISAPVASSLGASAFAQGGCRDGYGQPQGPCTLTKEVATDPITPVFEPTGWKTVGLDHITFEVADYRKEAAFYVALMGWTLRSDDGQQAILDMGPWGSTVFRQAGGGTAVKSFAWAIDPWNDRAVEAALRKRGMTPVTDWLKGDQLGWQGKWGTTYATNLRLVMPQMTLQQWLKYARTMEPRPPMPWFNVRAMNDRDLSAIYWFVKDLGPAGQPAPAYVPPGQQPKGPAVKFP